MEEEPRASGHTDRKIVVDSLWHVCVEGWKDKWVVRHTGESAKVDVKLSALWKDLSTVVAGDVASRVSDGCGDPTTGCDN